MRVTKRSGTRTARKSETPELSPADLYELMKLSGSERQLHPAYQRLIRDQNFANSIRRFRRAVANPKLPPLDPGAEWYLETKILFCVLDCILEVRRTKKPPSKKLRGAAIKSTKKLMRYCKQGIQLPDSQKQGQLESLLQQLVQLQSNSKRTYSGSRVHGRTQLRMLASTMLNGFWWCSPEFLLDVANMAGLDRDLSTMNRYIAAKRVDSPARFAGMDFPEPTPEQHAAIDAELDRLGIKTDTSPDLNRAYKSAVLG